MNRFKELNEKELALLQETGYIVEINKDYSNLDYERCANTITDYIMSHSKNEIPKIQNIYNSILNKIV